MNFRLTMVLVFLMLVAGIVFFWAQGRPEETKIATPTNTVFNPAPGDVVSMTLLRGTDPQVSFAKSGEKWAMTAPVKGAVESWQVDSVASTLKGLSYQEKFAPEASGAKSLEGTGLAKPRFSVKFEDAAKHAFTLLIGKRNAAGSSYAKVDGDPTNTVYVLEARSNPAEQLDKDPSDFRSKDLVDVATEKATQVTVTQKQKVVLTKSNGKWVMDAPVATRASTTAVDDLLSQFKQLKVDQFVSLARDDTATGLQHPALSVSVTETETAPMPPPPATTGPATAPATAPAKTKVTTIDFGNYSDLTKSLVYASLGGSQEAVLVQASSVAKLKKELNDLRDPAITPAPVAETTEVDIQRGSEKLVLTKDNAAWKATDGKSTVPGDMGVLTDFLAAVRDLRANKYVDGAGDLKSIGLDPPQETITLQLPGQAQRETILIGKAQNAEPLTPVQRQGEPTVYLVQTPDLAKLAPTLLEVRNRTVATWKADDVHDIVISGSGVKMPVTLTRDGAKWKLSADGKEMTPDDVKVSALLGELDGLQAAKWTAMNAPAADAKPVATVRLSVTESPAATQAGTQPATKPAAMGPTLPKTVEIMLYQGADKSWSAFTGAADPSWVFVPTTSFAEHVTTTDYRPASATQAATQSATQAASQPATMP